MDLQGRMVVTTLLQIMDLQGRICIHNWVQQGRIFHKVCVFILELCKKIRPCCTEWNPCLPQGRIFLQSSMMNMQNLWKKIQHCCTQLSATLLHSIVLMYANLCSIAHTTLLFWQDDLCIVLSDYYFPSYVLWCCRCWLVWMRRKNFKNCHP